jgi:hypothetical protein
MLHLGFVQATTVKISLVRSDATLSMFSGTNLPPTSIQGSGSESDASLVERSRQAE